MAAPVRTPMGFRDDRDHAADLFRQHALEHEVSVQVVRRQIPRNHEQVPVAVLAGVATRSRAEQHDCHQLVAQAAAQRLHCLLSHILLGAFICRARILNARRFYLTLC